MSSSGGQSPRWSPDGSAVYFWKVVPGPDSLFRARVDRTPSVVVRAPELALTLDILPGFWDLHPDGKRIIVAADAPAPAPAVTAGVAGGVPASRYLVVLNWFEQLKALTGQGRR